MLPDALETLRLANSSLGSALSRLRPERKLCATITPQDFSDLRNRIQQTAECLQGLASASVTPGAIEREAAAFRCHLENLQQFLPDLLGGLLAEKSRLEAARTRVAAATAWAHASQKTL